MRAATIALTPLEITVGSGRTVFTGFQAVRIHGQAHGATRLPPFEASFNKDLVQTFLLGLLLDQTGARHHQHLFDGIRFFAALGHLGCGSQVFNA